MRRYLPALAAAALLAAGGFATASIAGGRGFALVGTTATTATTAGKQAICHRTRSKKKPWKTITVSSRAVPAHLRHGDTLGACASASTTSTTASSSQESSGNGHGNGGGNGHGNGKGKKP